MAPEETAPELALRRTRTEGATEDGVVKVYDYHTALTSIKRVHHGLLVTMG